MNIHNDDNNDNIEYLTLHNFSSIYNFSQQKF